MAEPVDGAHENSALGRHWAPVGGGAHGRGVADAEYHSELDNTDESELEEEHYESDESENQTWISWFLSHRENAYFCEVPEEFIEDEFNLTGLSQTVNYYAEALDMILDIEDNDDPLDNEEVEAVEGSAEILYGLIHARFILTRDGLHRMAEKYENGEFGVCPRYYCGGIGMLPCGRSDIPERDSVKLFCPSCLDIYLPSNTRYQKVDGAYFGTTFPHMLLQAFPNLVPDDPTPVYTPRVYGFAINERSKSGPRMQWLRVSPDIKPGADNDDDAEEDGNTTDSQSYMEARDINPSESRQVPANTLASSDLQIEGMEVGTDRPGASRASTPAASSELLADGDDHHTDAVMATASNSPRQACSESQSEDRRKGRAAAL
ncbi:casein kinase 2 regulatory subunit [Coemansia sp. RSA 1836]|nr:casein kinase 2 regulatory subunit [Coemansia sp. RSA 2052]KAJ2584734.1 casein kinase 2 regulatory subunit [Coemansia sp. RSA 1836]